MLDPDQIAEDERAAEALRALAALAGEFYDALRRSGVPDHAAQQMLVDWHSAVIDDGITWEDDSD